MKNRLIIVFFAIMCAFTVSAQDQSVTTQHNGKLRTEISAKAHEAKLKATQLRDQSEIQHKTQKAKAKIAQEYASANRQLIAAYRKSTLLLREQNEALRAQYNANRIETRQRIQKERQLLLEKRNSLRL